MSDRDQSFKRAAAQILESLDLRVVEIPRAAKKTPDLLIEDGTPDATLIELKQKSHDQSELDAYFKQVNADGIASRNRPTNKRNRFDAIIQFGVEQLTSKDPSRAYFHVIWFHCEGYDADLHEMRLWATIYGTQQLISTEHKHVITCYYFWNSSFFRHRQQLDAVIVSRENHARLAVNDHSAKFELIQRTKLLRALGKAVFIPKSHGLSDDVMLCEHCDKRDSEIVAIEYLKAKYGLANLQTINMKRYEAIASAAIANRD